jgi:hypothetical protein
MGNDGGQQRGGQAPAFGQRNQNRKPAVKQAPQISLPAVADTVLYKVDGNWDFTMDSPQGGSGAILLKNENGVYSGTIKTNRMTQETPLQNVSVEGNAVSFTYPVNFGGNSNTVEVKYTVSNNDINGTMNVGQFGSFNLTGKRSE